MPAHVCADTAGAVDQHNVASTAAIQAHVRVDKAHGHACIGRVKVAWRQR